MQLINKTNYLFSQHKNADFSIFQRYFSRKFQGLKKRFYSSVVQWQRLVTVASLNAAVCILAQSEKECSLIWKAKHQTIKTDKSKW